MAEDGRNDEGAQEKKLQSASDTANLIPFAGGAKMLAESARGKDLSGKELHGKERITHAATGAASLALDFTGVGEAEKAGVAAERAASGSAGQVAGRAGTHQAKPLNQGSPERRVQPGDSRVNDLNARASRTTRRAPPDDSGSGGYQGSPMGRNYTLERTSTPVVYRVNMLKTITFIGMGVGLDIFDFILGITGVGEIADEIVDGIADFVIPATAWLFGIPLGGKKADQKMQTILLMEIAKIIPLVNILPEYTYETWKLIDYTRQEDRERARETEKKNREQDRIAMQRAMRAAQIRQQQLAERSQQAEMREAA